VRLSTDEASLLYLESATRDRRCGRPNGLPLRNRVLWRTSAVGCTTPSFSWQSRCAAGWDGILCVTHCGVFHSMVPCLNECNASTLNEGLGQRGCRVALILRQHRIFICRVQVPACCFLHRSHCRPSSSPFFAPCRCLSCCWMRNGLRVNKTQDLRRQSEEGNRSGAGRDPHRAEACPDSWRDAGPPIRLSTQPDSKFDS
jgi:hypothetical protein